MQILKHQIQYHIKIINYLRLPYWKISAMALIMIRSLNYNHLKIVDIIIYINE